MNLPWAIGIAGVLLILVVIAIVRGGTRTEEGQVVDIASHLAARRAYAPEEEPWID